MNAIGLAIGFLLGLLSSFLFWLFTNRWLVPKIRWSPQISCIEDAELQGVTKCRVKIMNVGRRAAVDFSATCLLRVPNAGTYGNTKMIQLRTLDVPLPYLAPGRSRVMSIKTTGLDPVLTSLMSKKVAVLLNANPPTSLRELLTLIPEAEIEIHLTAYDEVSGTRRNFRPKQPYTLDQITDLPFASDSVEVHSGSGFRRADRRQRLI
jgi:hypothetical protein